MKREPGNSLDPFDPDEIPLIEKKAWVRKGLFLMGIPFIVSGGCLVYFSVVLVTGALARQYHAYRADQITQAVIGSLATLIGLVFLIFGLWIIYKSSKK